MLKAGSKPVTWSITIKKPSSDSKTLELRYDNFEEAAEQWDKTVQSAIKGDLVKFFRVDIHHYSEPYKQIASYKPMK